MSRARSQPDVSLDETPYQVLPELDAEEYRALKEDIRENGIIVPITVDADGRHAVPETAVLEGIRVSGQGIAGDASSHLTRAVEAGALQAERVVAETGNPTLRGYRCPEVHPDGT